MPVSAVHVCLEYVIKPTDVVLHLLGDGIDGLSKAGTEGARNKTRRGALE